MPSHPDQLSPMPDDGFQVYVDSRWLAELRTERDRLAQARFRQQVRAAAGHQCQAIEDGARCRETEGQAHHTEAGNDDPATGVFLCRRHHRLVDPHAR